MYKLYDPNTHKVEYIGRTTKYNHTTYRHKANPYRKHLKIGKIAENLTRNEARGLEQEYIMRCNTLNKKNKTNNQINGIYWKNKNWDTYMYAVLLIKDEKKLSY